MNTKRLILWASATLLAMSSLSVQAVPSLYGYSLNIDGVVSDVVDAYNPFDPVPAGVDDSGFDDITGLGSINITITGTGAHSFDAFFDHEIDEAINTWSNESAAATGTAAAGQSWETDEPGWFTGDIYENFQVSALDNGIGTSIYGDAWLKDDVSMAMGWDFSLGLGETAIITLLLSDTDNGGGFFLTHSDFDSQYEFYLSSTLDIRGGGTVPEPSILLLLGVGLAGMVVNRRRKKA